MKISPRKLNYPITGLALDVSLMVVQLKALKN